MKYFTLSELTATNTGIKNNPAPAQISNLTALIANILDPLRELYGRPIKINSGFRCTAVNVAVGGTPGSQHLKGEAADITGENNKLLFNLIKDNFVFDQLINEKDFTWIHISFSQLYNRNHVLKIK